MSIEDEKKLQDAEKAVAEECEKQEQQDVKEPESVQTPEKVKEPEEEQQVPEGVQEPEESFQGEVDVQENPEVPDETGITENVQTVKRIRKMIGRWLAWMGIMLGTILLISLIGFYFLLKTICHGPSESASNLFVSTILETGAMQFLASLYFSEEEILEITNKNSMVFQDEEVNTELIVINPGKNTEDSDTTEEDFDINGVEIVDVAGRTFAAKLMIVNDPSRVKVATMYPWSDMNHSKNGLTLEQHVKNGNYLGGVNGGIYVNGGHWGGRPKGLVVSEGEIQMNEPEPGDVMIGFNEDNILVIKAIGDMTEAEVEQLVLDERIRDAVTFKDEMTKDNNHFAQLIINGKPREITGSGSGANPRTAIGQRADGSVLLLVTDGRGASGHLGATAADLLNIMLEYEAVNAANLDGGSSSAMYYEDHYEMNSVTLVYSTNSWNLPTTVVVERRDD